MDEKMFANYAEQLEKEDFEDEVGLRLFKKIKLSQISPGPGHLQQHPAACGCASGDNFEAESQCGLP